MPLYTMEYLEGDCDGEIKDFFFTMKDAPSLGEIREIDGRKWKRIILNAPMGLVKGTENPVSPQQFVHDSARKKGTIGNLFDESRDQSEKRAKQSPTGRDPIKDKWFSDWSKKRQGKRHPSDDRPTK